MNGIFYIISPACHAAEDAFCAIPRAGSAARGSLRALTRIFRRFPAPRRWRPPSAAGIGGSIGALRQIRAAFQVENLPRPRRGTAVESPLSTAEARSGRFHAALECAAALG